MTEIILELFKNPKTPLLIFLFFCLTFCAPIYSSYRLELALGKLTDRIECGNKIKVTAMEATAYDPEQPRPAGELVQRPH